MSDVKIDPPIGPSLLDQATDFVSATNTGTKTLQGDELFEFCTAPCPRTETTSAKALDDDISWATLELQRLDLVTQQAALRGEDVTQFDGSKADVQAFLTQRQAMRKMIP